MPDQTWYCLALLFLFLLRSVEPAAGQALPEDFSTEPVATQLGAGAVGFDFLPDGRLLLIYKRSGHVKVFADGALSPDPLLTVQRLAADSERGLLGIAVDPDFPDLPYVYLFHTRDDQTNRVTRFTAEGELSDPASADLSLDSTSAHTLIAFPDTTRFHNGGTLRFASDRTLYISHGDDAYFDRVQDLTTLNGKILRLHRDGSIPADNPTFPDAPAEARPETYAFGLRNPFRFSIDPATGALFIGDVGTNLYEELNVSYGGENFGYPYYEGPGGFREVPLLPPEPTFPVYAYPHGRDARSAIALAAYRPVDPPNDASFPIEYDGAYFYADFFDDELRYLKTDIEGNWADHAFGTGFSQLIDGRVAPDGSLYVLEYGRALHRIAYGERTGVGIARREQPATFQLAQNHPNPFTGTTVLSYTLYAPQEVRLTVFDVLGREVTTLIDAWQNAGPHTARFDAGHLPRGVYFYQLQAGSYSAVKAMLLAY